MTLVRAAGGLVWRAAPDGPRIAVVHRPRRRDWSLPKGKLEPGEAWETAALREVEEETGCRARLGAFAGATRHEVKGRPKIVLYWHMDEVASGPRTADEDEVDEVAWLAPEAALVRLDHENERALLAAAAALRGGAVEPALAGELARAREAVLAAVSALATDDDPAAALRAIDRVVSAHAAATARPRSEPGRR